VNITTDQQAFEYLKQLAADNGIDVAGAKVRRSSSRFCLGVEHGDYLDMTNEKNC
jgi:galactokinase